MNLPHIRSPGFCWLGRGLLLLAVFGAATGLARERQEIKLQLKWKHQFQFAGYYAALEKGYYKEEGLRVRILEGGPDRPPVATVLNGAAEFGVTDSDLVLQRIQGKPLVALAAIFQHSPYVILTRKDRNIRVPSDLIGARVMMADEQGAAQLRAMLMREGISADEVTIERHSWNLQDLVDGRVDAMSAYAMVEPHALRRLGVEPFMIRSVDYGVDFYGDTLFTTEAYTQKHPKRVEAFVRASLRGWRYAMENPEEVAELILKLPGVVERGVTRDMLLEQAAGMRTFVLPDVVEIGHMNRGRWQNIAATFSNVGVAPKNFSMDGFLFEPASPISPRLVQALVLVGLVVLVLALLFALWNHQMRHLVRAKTAELEAEVCQRKLMESDLRKSRARLDLILQSVGEGIQGLDAEGRITFQNAAATEMFGEKADDMVGGVAHTLVHHSRADGSPYPVSECPIYATLRDGQTRRVAEDVFFRLDGISFPVEYVCSPVRAENGLTEGVVVSFRDITEKKKLEAQFLRSQRMESIGTLAGGIAHDLNNVLAPILMSIQLLRRRVQEKEDSAILETIQACAQRGADLVRQVLTFARGAEGLRMPVNLRQIGDDIAHIIQETFPKTLQFKIEIQKDVWPIVGDPTQLHQVFMNLCVNARDAMPTGGLLGMRIENFEVSSDTVSLDASAKPGRYVRVEISDTGAGIPEELQTRIFEPFFTTKEPGLGTGLGLSTTLAIVKSHGGFLQVSSKVGEGSVFRLCFPAEATVHVDASLEQDTDSDSPGRGEWILFVDDEESIREVARQILENAGYVMVPATHGAEAVTTFAKSREKIALVITDMAMPQMDGPTAIKAIRAIAPEIPIIGSSGVTDHDIMEKARTLSLDCFLGKPYTTQALLAAIRSTLKNRSSGGPHTISLK